MSSYLPKDFIETAEGLIFAVVAADLDQQRVLASLRYRQTEGGYEKLSTRDADELLKHQYPEYIHYSKARDVTLHGVHHDLVKVHHQPRKRLCKILQRAPADEIEAKLQRLLTLFEGQGVDTGEIGVTGSLLIGAHKTGSDIDLVFYQPSEFRKAREVIKSLLHNQQIQPLDEALWQDAYQRRGCSLTYAEYLWHEKRKYNKAAIEQTKFDVTLLSPEPWQDLLRYRKQGRYSLQAGIDDDCHSFDYPARYRLDHPSVREAVSYTATYVGQAVQGERVEIQGQLEVSAVGHLRIVIGTDREASNEYIKVMPVPDSSG
ncbi:MAG: nucleotidyltransferase domain-containing protein [Candidatus Thiodiazotropha sp.]